MMRSPDIPSYFRIFRTKDPDTFEYKPRYYDPDKEERQERNRRIEQEVKASEEAEERIRKEDLRERIQGAWRGEYARQTQMANMRLLVILVMLCLICYIIFAYLGALENAV